MATAISKQRTGMSPSIREATETDGQFGNPTGPVGWTAGLFMSVKNRGLNRVGVDLLDVQPTDRVLEIGFGPGTAIAMLAQRAANGHVAGVDISEVMVKQGSRRNRKLISSDRVKLDRGSVSCLPYESGSFDKVFVMNTFHHWPDQVENLREVRRVMREGGLLLLGLRMAKDTKSPLSPPGFSEEELGGAEEKVREAGFRDVRVERCRAGREIACLMAKR